MTLYHYLTSWITFATSFLFITQHFLRLFILSEISSVMTWPQSSCHSKNNYTLPYDFVNSLNDNFSHGWELNVSLDVGDWESSTHLPFFEI
jgi:hypothetical protein